MKDGNQKQIDFEDYTVGNNRPDVQYNKGDIHYNVEFDSKSNNEFIILK